MENKDNANKKNTANDKVYKGKDNNATMFSAVAEIVYNGKIVSVHGNEYDFGKHIKVNGQVYGLSTEVIPWNGKFYGFEYEKKSSNIPSNVEIKFSNSNNKDYSFKDPSSFYLYGDFLLRQVKLDGKNDKPLEKIRLWKLKDDCRAWAWMYNDYNFDENNHISGVEQAVTLVFFTQKDSPFLSKELKDLKNMSPREKLLIIINNIANENKANRYQLAFDGHNAYALIKDKLYFFDDTKVFVDEKTKEVKYTDDKRNVLTIDNLEKCKRFLTAYKDKVFIASDDKKILVFNKDRVLESKIKLSGDFILGDLCKCLSVMNLGDLTPRLDEKQFEIEIKRYFDKCVQKEADKKKEEELNKKNNESKKEDKKEDKINNDKKEDEKDNKNENCDKNEIIDNYNENEIIETDNDKNKIIENYDKDETIEDEDKKDKNKYNKKVNENEKKENKNNNKKKVEEKNKQNINNVKNSKDDKKEDEKDKNNNKNNNKTEVKGYVDKSLKEINGKEKGSGMGNG